VGTRVINERRKKLEEAKRNKLRSARKFKSTEQFDMVKVIEQEAADLETRGKDELAALEQGIVRRKEALQERAQQMEEAANREGREDSCRSAARVYELAAGENGDGVRHAFAQFVLTSIHEDHELAYLDFYKNVFSIVPGLSPTEKVLLRKALASKTTLEEGEMPVSPEDEQAYQQYVITLKTEINMDAPGTLEQRFVHKMVNTTVGKLLDAGLTQDSLGLLMSMPVNAPNKPPAKLPAALVKKLLALNQLMHPFPENEIVLPNVAANETPEKRINFNRLDKVLV
jgi:hypothetical protein